MIFNKTKIDGLFIIEPKVFGDDRGYFFESFSKKLFDEATSGQFQFVQDNQSMSQKGVLRGLHFQNPPHAQGKLVRVIQGSVIDVAVDIRKNSPTYGEHVSVKLSAENKKQFWIPPGFAHGFLSLENDTIFAYKCTGLYAPQSEGAILWNDPALNINWGEIKNPLISEKDSKAELFTNFVSNF